MVKKNLICVKCGKKFPTHKYPLTCPSHSPYYGWLTVVYEYDQAKSYHDLLPIKDPKVSLKEGSTPLLKMNYKGDVIYIKNEGQNPTGSFKDRESFVVINKALEFGIGKVHVVSSGNAALSIAAYSNLAGIDCTCYIPKKTSQGKKNLIKLYGANIKGVKGAYEDVYRKVVDMGLDSWNVTPGLNPYSEEGDKTIAYEIFEEIGVPDKILVPCGNGTNLYGIWKGFKELKKLGEIEKIPQMIGVQIKGASPIKVALEEDKDFAVLENVPSSVAEGIVASESYSSFKAKKAIEDTNGKVIEVTDEETKDALNEVVKDTSLLPEPTSAVVFAALERIKKVGKIVLILTGTGIKNLKEIIKIKNEYNSEK